MQTAESGFLIAESEFGRRLTDRVDLYRHAAAGELSFQEQSKNGQFFTPPDVAWFMASLFERVTPYVRLLDAGAGVGSLTAAYVEEICRRSSKPCTIDVTAYEQDHQLVEYLRLSMAESERYCQKFGIRFSSEIVEADFVADGVNSLGLLADQQRSFNRIIMNPPYGKIGSKSRHRHLLQTIGLETGNLYTAFLAVAIDLLEPGGELVAITPRSYCNGPYFKPFRQRFLDTMVFRRIHVYETRDRAFAQQKVLQENIIFLAVKGESPGKVLISASSGPDDEFIKIREVDHERIVNPEDPELFIHIATTERDQQVIDRINSFKHTLADLHLSVSTGRVVDFRAAKALRADPADDTVPLIYPTHMERGFIRWPKPGNKKNNAIVASPETHSLLLPAGYYVLVKRFSSKEERRRIVASIYDPTRVAASQVGFENHLNVFHRDNTGIPEDFARGLTIFLNSTLIDTYFRHFSGHTQVNATDLRLLRYPSQDMFLSLADHVGSEFPTQQEIDELIEREIQRMTEIDSQDPVAAQTRIREALDILKVLGLPRGQQNDRSSLTLLALLNLLPDTPWSEASEPLMGITPIMDFCREHYGVDYAPNTRETIRRQTMHQFVQAGLAVPNPDQPDRPPNSPHFCYQIEPDALTLLQSYGTAQWPAKLKSYLTKAPTLKKQYARERKMNKVPTTLADGTVVYLAPGKHSELMRAVVDEFAPRYTPGAKLIYLGDTGDKWQVFDEQSLRDLGVTVDTHGKMPDVVLYDEERHWLVLIEAVTSHGPVDAKRHQELSALFAGAKPGLVYVTAFLTRSDLARYLTEISWETEVWVRDAPTHLIHFDGEKFLGPYGD